eukprot:s224_g7.t1
MAMEGEAAQAAGSGVYSTAVPWSQIPKFIPGETDVKVYARKLEFLRELWPADALEQLAPRAALLVEGVAFQKVSRMDPTKLKSKDGVRHLVEALGGQWGRLASEERYDLFERALYTTAQKGDESNDSYLARHDAVFEDLIAAKISIEEVRAYVLVRQSVMQAEDRKKVILDCAGSLTYDQARKSMRLLGSKFFQDLQSNNKSNVKYKTYDVNQVEEEPVLYQETEEEFDEEIWFQSLLDTGDEDAMFCNDFEEQILTACQESAELAACFTSYQEARQRLRDKARGRGFWPLAGGKGKSKTKKGKTGNASKGGYGATQSGFRRRSLADRIANSNCRRCGQPGHWRRECPMAVSSGAATMTTSSAPKKGFETESFTGLLHEDVDGKHSDQVHFAMHENDVIDELPEGAVHYEEDGKSHLSCLCVSCCESVLGILDHGADVDCFVCVSQLSQSLTSRLTTCCRKYEACNARPAAEITPPPCSQIAGPSETHGQIATASADVFASEEADDEAIIDTGASRAVIGSERLKRLVKSLPSGLRSRVMKVPTDGVVFKFGNAGRLTSSFAVMLPRSQNGWLRVEVVPGHTPFLISNAILRGLKGIIDVEGCQLGFKGSEVKISLNPVRKNLMGVKITELKKQLMFTKERTQDSFAQPLCQQPWLATKIALKVEWIVSFSQSNMASDSTPSYLDRVLTTPTDPNLLIVSRQHDEFPSVLTRPPGINTLTDWGRMSAPSGKHVNRSFADLYENERGYMNQLWNRRAVSTWVRSFQLYCRERRAASQEHQRRQPKEVPPLPVPRANPPAAVMAPVSGPVANISPMLGPVKTGTPVAALSMEEGWINIPVETAVPEEPKICKEGSKTNKRNMQGPSQAMDTSSNPEKVAQLRTQIAILQRELDKETRGSSSTSQD